MKTYLVGGAVRDRLLGRPVTEHDYVVVGATPDDLVALGLRPVGKDFPVFLHPRTGEQYALARTERKTGPGYYGVETRVAPDVTLEEDLAPLTVRMVPRPRSAPRSSVNTFTRPASSVSSPSPLKLRSLPRSMSRSSASGVSPSPASRVEGGRSGQPATTTSSASRRPFGKPARSPPKTPSL